MNQWNPNQPPQGYPQAPQQGYPQAPQQPGYPAPPQQGYQQQVPPQQPAWPQPPQGYPAPGGYPAPVPVPAAPAQPYPPQQMGYPQPGAPAGYAPSGMRQAGAGPSMDGFDSADPTGSRLPHFNAGFRYLLKNTKIEFFQGRKDNFMNFEWAVLQSNDPQLPAGAAAKYMIKWDQDMSMPNYKATLGALAGYASAEEIKNRLGQAEALEAFGAGQPYKDKIVELRTTATTTKQNKPFTVHNWFVPGADAGDAPFPAAAPQPAALPPTGGWSAPVATAPQAAPPAYGAPPGWAPAAPAPSPAPQAAPPAYAPPQNSAPGFAPMPAPGAPPPGFAPFPAPPQAQFQPPPGWYPMQGQPGFYHDGKQVKSEHQLRTGS